MSILNGFKSRTKHREWIEGFEQTNSLFIHIPKAAGTSISLALYKEDPWHYPISNYGFLSSSEKDSLFKFAFVRNPYDRILSTYLYAFKQIQSHPNTSVAFVTEYPTFSDFVKEWITTDNIHSHYFFYPQMTYIKDENNQIGIDYLGRFETLQQDFDFVCRRLNQKLALPEINKVEHEPYTNYYTKELAQIVYQVYQEDFEQLCYSKEINSMSAQKWNLNPK